MGVGEHAGLHRLIGLCAQSQQIRGLPPLLGRAPVHEIFQPGNERLHGVGTGAAAAAGDPLVRVRKRRSIVVATPLGAWLLRVGIGQVLPEALPHDIGVPDVHQLETPRHGGAGYLDVGLENYPAIPRNDG